MLCACKLTSIKLSQDVSQTFGLDKPESEIPVNPVDMPQSTLEQERLVESSTVQNDDHKVPTSGIESDSAGVELNKEADNPPVQYATEFNAVSNLWKYLRYNSLRTGNFVRCAQF